MQQLQDIPTIRASYSSIDAAAPDILKSTQILVTRYSQLIGENELRMLPNLRLIVQASTGYDNVDLDAVNSRDIKFILAEGASTMSVAEHTIMFALLLCKQGVSLAETTRRGLWLKSDYKGQEINGKTLGIIGLGRIGKQVSLFAKALGMRVLAYDPFLEKSVFGTAGVVQQQDLHDLLNESDIVSLHVPLGASTRNLVSMQFLTKMKKSAYLINTSRGEIVDEQALVQVLESGMIKGAALDVFAKEPLYESPFFKLENVILTPHVAGVTHNSLEAVCSLAIEKVAEWANTSLD